MNKDLTQKERIIQFIEKEGISKNKFYTQTGISNGTLDKKSGITGDTIFKISKAYPDLNLEWLITGEGEMMKSSIFPLSNNMQTIREQYAALVNIDPEMLTDKSFQAPDSPLELIPIFAYNETQKHLGYLSIPNLGMCDGAGIIKTDSMYPLIKPGDIVCYKTANNTNHIHWGQAYIVLVTIDGEEFLTIKNLEQSEVGENYVKLTGYNHVYNAKDVPIECIKWKALVKAYVSYNSVM
ncbi:hypothetical protein JGH11_13325 [Dysgonomonas sp. Marseille-P4677]|uniref:LexA family transcriptional regulator n=1 Tax=Dysgonomonas sp. Marseille-P4677 TaxID=2364790 RepID=UPI0019142DD6|nr:S24 family peptidase [Dysgonomonas sp. Marseille-P4677]MBK5721855.1 hypothetical protein [Dysgonomonas sp. Marseille-P4677]